MHFALFNVFTCQVVVQFLLLELKSATRFVYFHVKHLVGGFTFTLDNLQLLPMIANFSDNVGDFIVELFDGSTQTVATRA